MAITYNTSIVRSGLILHLDAANRKSYPGTGTTWTDLSGNGNNGTLINGPTFNSSNSGNITVDGLDDYIICGNGQSLNILTSLTASAWVYFLASPSATGNPSIIDKWDWPNNKRSYALGTETGLLAAYVSYDGTFPNRIVCFGSSPALNRWINLTMVYNNQTLSLYQNGMFLTSASYNQTRNLYDNVETEVFIGRSRGTEGSIRFLNARIGNIQINNRALTAEEVRQNFEALRYRYGI